MTEATQPRMARGTKLPAAILAAALFALLAFAPFASAAPDPVASGSATITLNNGFVKSLNKRGIKIKKIGATKLQGKKATMPVVGGEMDPTNGAGTLTLAGGLKFQAGKKKAPVKELVIDTTKKGLFAKVGGKKVKFGAVAGFSFTRVNFGVSLTIKKLKLTKAAAKQLNKKLGFKKGKKPFVGNRLMASAAASEEPSTVTIVPSGTNVVFDANTELLKKLKEVKTDVETISPATAKGNSFEFPISGGTIAPTASAGVVQSIGGVKLFQKLPKNEAGTENYETEITLGNFYVDLSAHTVSVEVVAKSNASDKLNLGALGRSSIADLTLTGATVTTDVTNRRVNVQNAGATLQPVSAEVLNGFVVVYKAWVEGVAYAKTKAGAEAKGATPEEADALGKVAAKVAGEEAAKNEIHAGDALGTFSFSAQTQ
ncbi:MAG TPA: HtaA domain-containing protein [Solirubrobacterales bacterium]|nr:HtaA domain-containing protein [Solirubrobacterales bacterium]